MLTGIQRRRVPINADHKARQADTLGEGRCVPSGAQRPVDEHPTGLRIQPSDGLVTQDANVDRRRAHHEHGERSAVRF